jgi:hypothetical protein
MSVRKKVITLDEFIIQREKDFPYATGDLSALLRDIGVAAKIVHREVNKAGLVDILGNAGSNNVQGEEVKKLDVFANEPLENESKLRTLDNIVITPHLGGSTEEAQFRVGEMALHQIREYFFHICYYR